MSQVKLTYINNSMAEYVTRPAFVYVAGILRSRRSTLPVQPARVRTYLLNGVACNGQTSLWLSPARRWLQKTLLTNPATRQNVPHMSRADTRSDVALS